MNNTSTNNRRRDSLSPDLAPPRRTSLWRIAPGILITRDFPGTIAAVSLLTLMLLMTGCSEGTKTNSPVSESQATPAEEAPVAEPKSEPAPSEPAPSTSASGQAPAPAATTPPPAPPIEAGTTPPTSPASPPPSTPVPAPPGWKTFVNTVDALPEDMKPKFVDFTFNYPEKFATIPGDDTNFIKVEESLTDPVQGSFTLENFAVGNMIANPEPFPGMDQEMIYPMLLEQLGAQFGQNFPNYQKIGEAPEEVAGLRGRALLFQAEFKGTDKGDIKFFGKTLLVRRPGKERGVVIIMLATSLDPDVKSAADVGVKGDLGAILKSFRLTGE